MLFDYRHGRKLSALGFCSGAVAALVAITPASGYVAPWASIVIGFSAGLFCNMCCHLKHILGYDDALDVFGTHGMGGFLGNILTGIFAQQWVARLDGGKIDGGWVDGNWIQVPKQLAGSAAGAAWSFCWTAVIVLVMQLIPCLALRLNTEDQELGADLAEMGEVAYTVNDALKAAKRRLSSFGASSKKDHAPKPPRARFEPRIAKDDEQPKEGSLAIHNKSPTHVNPPVNALNNQYHNEFPLKNLSSGLSPTKPPAFSDKGYPEHDSFPSNRSPASDYTYSPERSHTDNGFHPTHGVLSLQIE